MPRTTALTAAPPKAAYVEPDEIVTDTGLSRNSVYRALKNGEIPSLRVGSRYVIPRAAYERWFTSAGQQTS